MVVKSIDSLPVFVPIEHHNLVVVTATENVRQSWVHNKMSNEVRVLSTNCLQFFRGVHVVYSNLGVIATNDQPLLSRDELGTPNGGIRNFERFNLRLRVVVENDNVACVECY